MNTLAKILFTNLIMPIITSVLAASITAAVSKRTTGNWVSLFREVPAWGWILILLVIIGWICIILIRRRLQVIRIQESNPYAPSIGINPIWGTREATQILHANVKWPVKVPLPSPIQRFENYEEQRSSINPESIFVDSPPRCPKCDTKLEEHKMFLRGYKWTCVECGFATRNRDSFYVEADRVEKIAESRIRRAHRG